MGRSYIQEWVTGSVTGRNTRDTGLPGVLVAMLELCGKVRCRLRSGGPTTLLFVVYRARQDAARVLLDDDADPDEADK
ncbi:hypothetical protein O9K51_10043 [Purpureocillium lavendulum]|uniref:Uncharacterized protein n=1 Tax=Purpureocillium lavendulum TaxID=1247861 RepID=A0AB34FE08_9HYPO|nr:hypothetical protein O9K51_10043 [Purpureocillium lavendulum]